MNNGTLTWHCHNKSYVVENESLSTVTNNGTAPTIVNSGTMDGQRITVINNGAGPVLSNMAGSARLVGTLTTVGNSEAVHVSGGEVKITQVTSGASGENSAAIVAAGGSVECVHDRNGKAALSAPKAETVIRVEPNGEFKFGSGYNSAPEFGTGTKYTLVNNGGTVSIGGNNKISGVMLNKAGPMNLTNVKATGKGQVVVDGGELTVSGVAAAEDLKNDIIMLNGGAVVLAGGTYKTNTGYYAVRVVNKDASLTAKGGVDMTNSAVYLCTDAKMAVLKEGDTAPRVKIVMETPGVFAENVTEDLSSTVSSANANYAVKYNATAKTLSLELTGEHKHDSTTYKQLKDTDTALTAGCYYLPQSVKMEHDLTISGDVTICLNGSTLSFGKFGSGSSDYYKVKVQDGGTLTIQDELTGGGKLTDGGIQLAPTADFTLESGTLEAKEAVCITGSTESTNTNTVTVKGGAITALWAVRNVVSGATVNVTGGTLTMPPAYTYGHGSDYDYQALIGMNGGTLTISGGTWVQENKTFGMLVGPSSTTASNFTGTVTVTGGSFTIGRRGFELYDGTASFSNVIFTTLSGNSNLSNAIRCYGNAQVKLNKVTFDTIHGVSVSDTANATLTDVTVKTYTIPADNLYLTKDITWTIKEEYDSCHRFTMNGERYLCLNGHDLTLKLGTRETWSKLYSTDAARQKLTITNCAEHPSTIYGSIDLGYSGYSWDKYNPTDRLVLENLTVAGRIDMRKVKYTGEDYTTSLDHVTVTPADDFGSTVQLGAGKHIIKNSTLTYNEPDSYKDYAYGALYLENANAKVTLEGTVNITGGFGLYGRGGTVDASRLSPDSKIVLGAGKSAIYDEYKYTITGVTEELRSCFTLSNYAPTSSYKPENYRLVYDAEARTLKIEEVETHYDKDSKVELTVSSSKYVFASSEPATLYAYWNTNDSACTLESYQWYAVDANGKKTSIPGATERTYTTDTLTPGTHKFTAVAYYTVTNSNRTYRKDATNDIIVKVNAAVDINTDGITITGFTNGIKIYDGTAVSYDGTATAEGYTGEFEYKWFKDGEDTLLTTAPKDAGKYYLKVSVPSGAAGYSGEAKIAFTISPATITVTPTANQSKVYGTADTALSYTYTGAVNSETANFIGALSRETGENVGIYAITQGNLALADKETFKASNYTLVFSEDMGNFTVSPKMLTADMVATITDQTYTGNAIKPAITVTDSEKTLTADDYTVTYESNTNAGTATVKITGKGNYTDEVSKIFTINPRALENDMITAIDAQVYTGKAITPEPEVKYGEIKLEKGTDYTVSYESNTAVGTATVTVTAVASGNYVGSVTANFAIGRADQTLGKTDMTATYGETFEVTPITGAQGEVIYAVKSGSESLLTKGEDGKFTAKSGTGTAYITATAAQTANYKQTSIDIPVELSKAHLTAKADDKSMYVNDTVPVDLTVSYTGFVNGDTKDMVVDKDATASIAAEVDGKTTGTFAITTNTDTKLKPGMEDNYTVDVQNGTLTISSRSSDGTGDGTGQTTYPVTVPDKTDNGSVSVNPKSAKQGDTVTITVTPDKGYILETITVTDKDGEKLTVTKKSDTEYTFVMPASEVEVKATFMDDNTMLNYFVDVKAADYYYDAVLWGAQNGITNGTDATHFSPDELCTRAQAVTFLWRKAGSPAPKSDVMLFTDVPAGSYYYDAVLWAVDNGITLGTSATTFGPNETCTRAHIVTFLWRFERCPAAGGENPFSDVSSRAYYADAVLWAVERDITNGTSETTFGPDESATRAQIVTFLYRDNMK